MLAPEGFLLQTAASGEEALAMVAQQPPDLILLDIMMPGMDGYQVAARIKGNPATKNIPVIMVTALDDRDARMLGLSAGAEDFLTKPVDRAELCVRVRNLLRLKAYGDYYDKYSQMLEGEVVSRTADLVESERLYRSTFDAAPVGIVHVGLDGQWLRVNQRLCDLLGYSREELQSRPFRRSCSRRSVAGEAEVVPADGRRARWTATSSTKSAIDGGTAASCGPGSTCPSIATPTGRPQHFISVIEDITERRTLDAPGAAGRRGTAHGGGAHAVCAPERRRRDLGHGLHHRRARDGPRSSRPSTACAGNVRRDVRGVRRARSSRRSGAVARDDGEGDEVRRRFLGPAPIALA